MVEDKEKLLKWYKEMGIDETLAKIHLNIATNNVKQSIKVPKHQENKTLVVPSDLEEKTRKICDNISSIEELKQAVYNFKDLPIAIMATNPVFSDGNKDAKVMIIGEAPGANEDATGKPFCGQSGKLLDKFFAFIGLSRANNLYITNSVFWRPPGNRRPTEEESKVCLPFLEKHIALVKPKLIIAVGNTSAQSLLNSNTTISELRGKFHAYNNAYLSEKIPVAVLFHPSYLLRQPSQKKVVWFDLLKIKKQFLS